MACFWTDLIGATQECEEAPTTGIVGSSVSNVLASSGTFLTAAAFCDSVPGFGPGTEIIMLDELAPEVEDDNWSEYGCGDSPPLEGRTFSTSGFPVALEWDEDNLGFYVENSSVGYSTYLAHITIDGGAPLLIKAEHFAGI